MLLQIYPFLRILVFHPFNEGSSAPKGQYFRFSDVFGPWGPFQSLLQALPSNFLSKMSDLDAYVSSYFIFRRFCRVWKVANPFLMIWDAFFMILGPRPQRHHPLQHISGPCSIEKYPSSRMANRYTRIFDAGGQDPVRNFCINSHAYMAILHTITLLSCSHIPSRILYAIQ